MSSTLQSALLVVAGLHAGFQLVVTVVVYPALADVPESGWSPAHSAHTRRISYLVAPLYAAVVVTSAAALWSAPDEPAVWLAVAGQAGALVVTALAAAPTHGRLGKGRSEDRVRFLLRADRWRCAFALVGLLGAVVAAR